LILLGYNNVISSLNPFIKESGRPPSLGRKEFIMAKNDKPVDAPTADGRIELDKSLDTPFLHIGINPVSVVLTTLATGLVVGLILTGQAVLLVLAAPLLLVLVITAFGEQQKYSAKAQGTTNQN
jgi:hypothetical protein